MESLILIAFASSGAIMRFTFKWYAALKKGQKFEFKVPLAAAILSLMVSIILVLVKDDISNILPFSPWNAVIYGWWGSSIFTELMDVKRPKIKK